MPPITKQLLFRPFIFCLLYLQRLPMMTIALLLIQLPGMLLHLPLHPLLLCLLCLPLNGHHLVPCTQAFTLDVGRSSPLHGG